MTDPTAASAGDAEQFCIVWRNTVSGRTGRGTKRFTQQEAILLAQQLNHDYPDIEHEACHAGGS
jgi:hypothetical protein